MTDDTKTPEVKVQKNSPSHQLRVKKTLQW